MAVLSLFKSLASSLHGFSRRLRRRRQYRRMVDSTTQEEGQEELEEDGVQQDEDDSYSAATYDYGSRVDVLLRPDHLTRLSPINAAPTASRAPPAFAAVAAEKLGKSERRAAAAAAALRNFLDGPMAELSQEDIFRRQCVDLLRQLSSIRQKKV